MQIFYKVLITRVIEDFSSDKMIVIRLGEQSFFFRKTARKTFQVGNDIS